MSDVKKAIVSPYVGPSDDNLIWRIPIAAENDMLAVWLEDRAIRVSDKVATQLPQVVALAARVSELEAALKPFAETWDCWPDNDHLRLGDMLTNATVGDARRAAALLAKGES